ncbi:MAG: NADH-quinone oxidoreductase subunit C/D [Lentisphaerae bacterium GWF2_57_35]|nr:MAG: NADH-quinone oxidoreductase subunit C/D [Lentisphaerae bacterium GWF2_57_35]
MADELRTHLRTIDQQEQETIDGIPTLWVDAENVRPVLLYLKTEARAPYRMLYDLTAIDERERIHRKGQPACDFSVVYHLMSFERNEDVRLKVPLRQERLSVRSVTDLWPGANWYEREMWDLFGIQVEAHPSLSRLLLPDGWVGHPLRKDHPARACDLDPMEWPEEESGSDRASFLFRPEDWGFKRTGEHNEFMMLHLGSPQAGVHGLFRLAVQVDGETIIAAAPEIGFHHRGAEKMGESQSWHGYIPYTDRIDYASGMANNLAYLLAVEKLAGIETPERVQVIRILMCELFRIASHLDWLGSFVGDMGGTLPLCNIVKDRERISDLVEQLAGARLHSRWFRIGGLSQDLPPRWDALVWEFLTYMTPRLGEYDSLLMNHGLFKMRTKGVGRYTLDDALDWGVTGPGLRACGYAWDFRKARPYSGYDQFDFEIPTATEGDGYARSRVRIEEMRQSLYLIHQCLDNMPAGPCMTDHPISTPPLKARTLQDVETLISQFLSVGWGPVIPAGEAFHGIETAKGSNGYYLISDGGTMAYRARIRTPSFPHVQMMSYLSLGASVADLPAILGSIDFLLNDVDR